MGCVMYDTVHHVETFAVMLTTCLEITYEILVVPRNCRSRHGFHLQPDVYKGEILHIVHQLIYFYHIIIRDLKSQKCNRMGVIIQKSISGGMPSDIPPSRSQAISCYM